MAIYHEDSRAPKFGVLSQNLSSELLTLLRVFLSYCDPSRMPCVCLWLSILSSFLSPTSRMAGVRQLAKNKNKFKLKMKSQEELSTTEESLLLFLWCFLQRLLLRDTSSTNRKVREKPFSHVSSWFRKRPQDCVQLGWRRICYIHNLTLCYPPPFRPNTTHNIKRQELLLSSVKSLRHRSPGWDYVP